MIKPTIGRIVWFWRSGYEGECLDAAQPFAATVCHVINDRCVNLSVTDHVGAVFPAPYTQLVQDGDPVPSGAHATWMPFQLGQAKKAAAEESSKIGDVGAGQPAAT